MQQTSVVITIPANSSELTHVEPSSSALLLQDGHEVATAPVLLADEEVLEAEDEEDDELAVNVSVNEYPVSCSVCFAITRHLRDCASLKIVVIYERTATPLKIVESVWCAQPICGVFLKVPRTSIVMSVVAEGCAVYMQAACPTAEGAKGNDIVASDIEEVATPDESSARVHAVLVEAPS